MDSLQELLHVPAEVTCQQDLCRLLEGPPTLKATLALATPAPTRLQRILQATRLLETPGVEDAVRREGEPELLRILAKLRRTVEDARVDLHWQLSATPLLPDEGVTEDVCYSILVALCDNLREQRQAGGVGEAELCVPFEVLEMGCVVYADNPVKVMTAVDIDCSLAAMFVHQHMVDWCHKQVRNYLSALQRRCSTLILAAAEGGSGMLVSPEQRSQWSCATARLKLKVLRATQQRNAAADLLRKGQLVTLPTNTESGSDSDMEEAVRPGSFNNHKDNHHQLDHRLLLRWLKRTVKQWDGSRLREAVTRGYKRRTLRADEAGRNCAFNGQSSLHRARGALDATEAALHSISFVEIVSINEAHAVGQVAVLQDVICMKLLHNALEAVSLDFMGKHVVLDSLREDQWRQAAQSSPDLLIVEINGLYMVDGAGAPPCTPTSFRRAFLVWYAIHYRGNDPLGINLRKPLQSEGLPEP